MFKTIDTWNLFENDRRAKNETNDCTVRALATIKGLSYNEAHKIMAEKAGRVNRKGVIGFMTTEAYATQGLEEKDMYGEQPTFAAFMRNNPNFTGIIGVRGHVFTVRKGVVYGNWDDGERTRARVRKIYTLTKSGAVITKELKKGLDPITIEVERRLLKNKQAVMIEGVAYRIQDDNATMGIVRNMESELVDLKVGMKRFYAAQQRRTRKAKKIQQANA